MNEEKFDVCVGGAALNTQAREKLEYFYRRSVEDRASNRAWQDYLAFDRLRHDLQNLKVDAFVERADLFTRRARRVVMADVAAFFEYDSLNDSLSLLRYRSAPWIEKTDERLLRTWLREVAQDSGRRSQSVLYRAIDTLCYQSRLVVQPESRPFAVGLVKDLVLIPTDREIWGIDPADVIVVPIQFHERLIGALYLGSSGSSVGRLGALKPLEAAPALALRNQHAPSKHWRLAEVGIGTSHPIHAPSLPGSPPGSAGVAVEV